MTDQPLPSIGRILIDSALILGATVLLTGASITGTILTHRAGTSDGQAECAIVFGAAVRAPDVAGPGLVRRVETAVRLYQQGDVQRLILSGGKGSAEQDSEANVMRVLALERGVPASALSTEGESHSTLENLRNSMPLLADCTSVVGVSDGYHLARIEMLADKVGLPDLRTYPADRAPNLTFEMKSIGREIAAYVWYSLPLEGNIDTTEKTKINE